MTSSPRICLVVPYGILGGAEAWALRLLDAWPHEVRGEVRALALGDGPVVEALRERGVAVTVREVGPTASDLARAVVTCRPDLAAADVVWANGLKAAMVAGPVRALGGAPVVWVKHDRSHDARLARPLGRAVRRVVAVSEVVADAVGRADTVLVPPPLPDGRPLAPAAARQRLLALAGADVSPRHVAVMVGRLSSYKEVATGVRALVDAEDWHLVVIGDADPSQPGEPDRLRALAGSLGVEARVHLVGAVPAAGRLLPGADATLVLTGFDEEGHGGEGWSTVALEALWSGSPLVGSPDGAPMAADSGGVVPTGDATAVAATLRELEDPAARRRAVAGGRRRLVGHPDVDAAAATLLDVLVGATRGAT